MELYKIVNTTYGNNADLRERSNSFSHKNGQIFNLDYYHHIYEGFQSFIDFFAGRAIAVGVIYFLYYLYPLT